MAAAHTGMNRQKDGDLFFCSAFVNNPEKTLDGFLVGLIKNSAKHRLHETLLDCYSTSEENHFPHPHPHRREVMWNAKLSASFSRCYTTTKQLLQADL